MSSTPAPYQPVSCSIYDTLEAYATQGKTCRIVYQDNEVPIQVKAVQVKAVIQDFFIQDKAEYLQLDNGQAIRLDRLISIDGRKC